ncbi:Activator of Hsp90 ATPase -like protein [uncultured archaeon]|nr:Activator of Hsp90 ATPase -like protein [uncultured archaeon]
MNKTQVREFVISRVFNATRERLWKALTEDEETAQWFGPKGATTLSSKNDFRTGGMRLWAMKAADGLVMWGKWKYKEITPPSKLVFVNSFSDAQGGTTRHPLAASWPLELLTTMTLEEGGPGQTKFTVHWLPINPTEEEGKAFMAGFDSMKGGWGGTFERLEEFLSK